ncbi:Flagellar hook-associated protein flgL [Vibrio chagasii]|nr:Flagellar hook-associated protein flgL [Vibrio chagasii]
MRVTVNTMYQSISQSTTKHFSALSNQMDRTQYRVLTAGDDPVAQKQIVNLKNNISELGIYTSQAHSIEAKLGTLDVQFGAYYDKMLAFDELLAEIGGGTHSEEDLKVFGNAARGLEQDISTILNFKNSDGTYMFGGTMVGDPPFQKELVTVDIDGEEVELEMYVYKGDHDVQYQKSGSTSDIPVTIDGSKLITDDNGKTIFEHIAVANHYLEQGEEVPGDLRIDMMDSISIITDNYIAARSELGGNINQATSNYRMFESMSMEYSLMLSNAQDANIVEVTTNIQKHSQILQVINNTTKVLVDMQNQSFLG